MLLKDKTILVIDDDVDVLTAVRILLKPKFGTVIVENNPEEILHHVNSKKIDLILLDMNYKASIHTGNEGLFWLRKIRQAYKFDGPVIMITAFGDIDLAIKCLKEGANDFVVKPWHNDKLLTTLKEAIQKSTTTHHAAVTESNTYKAYIIGASPQMKSLFFKLDKIAPTDANVLILGENGTGKELVAKAIHENSLRSNKPIIKVDMGALTESLFESELFGHKKGAFTDAMEDRMGRLEQANGGTLFLDEIANINLQQQSKLLSVLQNRQVYRVGENQPRPIDIRLICATNASLQQLADESKFRKDLIYRINTVELQVPALHERENDIALLAEHFIKIYAEKYGKPMLKFNNELINKLSMHNFPGNIRELQYVIERAVIMSEDDQILTDEIIFSPIEKTGSKPSKETNLGELEKLTILKVIEKHNGNISKAAIELGITRTALYRRMNKYEI